MNRKQRRHLQSRANKEPGIHFRGQSYTLISAFDQAASVENFHPQDAIEIYRLILAKAPDHWQSMNNLGHLLYQRNEDHIDEIIALYHKGLRLQPESFSLHHNLGEALLSKGQMKEAEEAFSKAHSLNPDFPVTLFSLTHMQKYSSPHHPHARQIQKLLKGPALSEHRAHLYFALGKIYDDCDLYDEAFAAYREANLICNRQVAYSPAVAEQKTAATLNFFSREFLAQAFSFSSESAQPLFIVGLPRSGTTLLAHILSNHPSVQAAGELVTIPQFTESLSDILGNKLLLYPEGAAFITPAAGSRMIRDYQKRLRRDAPSDTPYIIDKHPLNFRHLGFIAMLFPRARVIHCTRGPLDAALSNYFQYFDPSYDYSFDLGNIGHYYGEYQKFMRHWRRALPMPMLEIGYEDIVTQSEPTIRRALEFLGLEWDARCLTPHTNPRTVITSSRWQVRQPVYSRSVGRWRHYEKHLAPLKAARLEMP